MRTPRYLKDGDTVAIISTARKISEAEVMPAINLLESWGLKVVKGEYLHAEDNQFAGNAQQRALDLQKMLNTDSIKAIFCARGGYGTVQIIDEIDWSAFRRNPKWVIGYSDVTVLHNHIQRHCDVESIHATMPINFPKNGKENQAIKTLKSALFTGKNTYTFAGHPLNRPGLIQAPIVGGNLSIIYSLIGSASEVYSDNKILFMEDLDEYLYHIDRMIMNLKRNEKFKHLKALIVGGMKDMNDNTIPYGKSAIEIIYQHVEKCNYPLCFNFPAGHITDNRAIILGRNTVLEVGIEKSKFIQF
jgi:muramoyltetrapeptide carboxypeptidase